MFKINVIKNDLESRLQADNNNLKSKGVRELNAKNYIGSPLNFGLRPVPTSYEFIHYNLLILQIQDYSTSLI
jgi:hypothetical protein